MAALLFPELQFHDSNGVPLASGTIDTYVAGTSTPAVTYTNSVGDTSVGTTISLNAEGRPNSGNGIWLGTTTSYKFIIKNSAGTTIQTIDNISSGGFNGSSSFVTATAEAGLTSARILSAGSDVGITDNGAGSSIVPFAKHPLNSQTGTTYTAVAGDRGKFIRFTTQSTATLSITAAATLGDGWYAWVKNDNSSTLTIDPNGAETINGSAAIALSPPDIIFLVCTGSTFYGMIMPGANSSGAEFGTFLSSSNRIQTTGTGYISSATYLGGAYTKITQHIQVTQTNPAQITASQNNYAVTSKVNILTANGAYDITGLAVPSSFGSTDSAIIYLVNSSAFTLTLKHESASSTAANRFKFSTGADIALAADQTAALIYDNTADRWRNIPV